MLLLTVVYENGNEDIIDEVNAMKKYFRDRNIIIGFSESLEFNTHFLKIFCEDSSVNKRFMDIFNLYMSNILYNMVISEYYKKNMQGFLTDTYFFLKYDEIKEIKRLSLEAFKSEGAILNEYMVYFRNRKNSIIQKIIECIAENKEINIKGFITFRMKELLGDLESIIDKVVESYMVEREYNEFISLLKYFVELQDSKIDKVNILIQKDGSYIILDEAGNNIMDSLLSDLSDVKYNATVNIEDMLLSGLITNAPKKIIIHGAENCTNKEVLDTIKKVFENRAIICSGCNMCKKIRQGIKLCKD